MAQNNTLSISYTLKWVTNPYIETFSTIKGYQSSELYLVLSNIKISLHFFNNTRFCEWGQIQDGPSWQSIFHTEQLIHSILLSIPA